MEDVAVMDAAVEAAPVETPTESAVETPTDAATGGEPQVDQDEAAVQAAKAPVSLLDGQKLSPQLKAHLDGLKATDPALAAALKRTIYENNAFKQAIPGGVKEYQALKGEIESLGGPVGIKQAIETAGQFSKFDELYTAGDPAFVKELVQGDPVAFQKLAPAMFDEFARQNNAGFTTYIAKCITSNMAASGFDTNLQLLAALMPTDNPKVVEAFNNIVGYVQGLKGFAQKDIVPVEKQPQGGTDKEAELARREQELTVKEWTTAGVQQRAQVFQAEISKLTNGQPLSNDERAAVGTLFEANYKRALSGKPGYEQTVDRYRAAGDREGYLKYTTSTFKELMPAALRQAVGVVMRSAKTGKPAAAAAQPQAAAPAKPAAPAAPAGFQRVGKSPDSGEINYRVTDADMIAKRQAVLKDGRKVTWA